MIKEAKDTDSALSRGRTTDAQLDAAELRAAQLQREHDDIKKAIEELRRQPASLQAHQRSRGPVANASSSKPRAMTFSASVSSAPSKIDSTRASTK